MKFLSKSPQSLVLAKNLVYETTNDARNARIKKMLIDEQKGFCAYSEKVFQGLDSAEIEHFNRLLKKADNYYNYYAVVRSVNTHKSKKDRQYKGASFFQSLFFQSKEGFAQRIHFLISDNVYEEIDPNDTEARDFIDYLGLNSEQVVSDRIRHISRLRDLPHSTEDNWFNYFRKHRYKLSFVTAIEAAFTLDLTLLINEYQPGQ